MLATLPALQLLFPGKASGVFNVQGFSKEALQVTWVSPLSTDGPLVYLATAEAGLSAKSGSLRWAMPGQGKPAALSWAAFSEASLTQTPV